MHCFDPSAGDEHAQAMADGDVVRSEDVELIAVHTPGHTRDHLCFFDPATRTLYTGDHILSGTTRLCIRVKATCATTWSHCDASAIATADDPARTR